MLTSPAGYVAQQLFEFVRAEDMEPSFTFLVPAAEPDVLPWSWDTLGAATFVFFVVEIKCGDVLMVKQVGSHSLLADMASLGSVEGWSLDNPPDRFLVASIGAGGFIPIEKEIASGVFEVPRSGAHGCCQRSS